MATSFIVAGNWKMNTLPDEAARLAQAVSGCSPQSGAVTVVLIPPFVHLGEVARIVAGTGATVGAQNCYVEKKGAFTGEISAEMLAAVGCGYCLAGHSERRQFFGESDEFVGKKAAAILAAGMTPSVCVGETLAERQGGKTLEVVERQLLAAISAVGAEKLSRVVIAYEPVWAIGTGLAATAEQAQEVHSFIRKLCVKAGFAGTHILYGGSVTDVNAAELFAMPDINGALVGGASLKADSFCRIIAAAGEV